ncbi:MAG: hypothetical protein RIC55_11705 [Pirellulaceae bacterium]
MNPSESIDRWSAAQLKAALLDDVTDLTDEQIAAVQDFIERIGGIDNAQAAVDLLDELEFDDFDDVGEHDDLHDAA